MRYLSTDTKTRAKLFQHLVLQLQEAQKEKEALMGEKEKLQSEVLTRIGSTTSEDGQIMPLKNGAALERGANYESVVIQCKRLELEIAHMRIEHDETYQIIITIRGTAQKMIDSVIVIMDQNPGLPLHELLTDLRHVWTLTDEHVQRAKTVLSAPKPPHAPPMKRRSLELERHKPSDIAMKHAAQGPPPKILEKAFVGEKVTPAIEEPKKVTTVIEEPRRRRSSADSSGSEIFDLRHAPSTDVDERELSLPKPSKQLEEALWKVKIQLEHTDESPPNVIAEAQTKIPLTSSLLLKLKDQPTLVASTLPRRPSKLPPRKPPPPKDMSKNQIEPSAEEEDGMKKVSSEKAPGGDLDRLGKRFGLGI